MAIPESFLQQLLDRTDVVELVGRHVQLKRAGANFLGLCPFHGEKSPSFTVSPSKQFYHCFGCGQHGNAIGFLMEHNGLSFIDAVKDLAQAAGMQLPDDERSPAERARDAQQKARQQTLTEVLEQAAKAYIGMLKKTPAAQEYLKNRGLTGEIAKRFRLGWAPAGKPLAGVFANYDDPLLVESGLVKATDAEEGEARKYDRFRERIMFPIRNVGGAVIGFGGRVLGAGEPKYLNSPETPVFSKGRELYGLHEGRADIQQAGFVLVTEGYMDVVALAQHGIGNAVATLGTACTADHVQKLFRFTDEVVFSFDGDKAGQRAARRALEAVLPHATDTRAVKFLFLPTEHDPDSYVRAHGADAFIRLVHSSVPLSRFLLESARSQCDMASVEGRARFVSHLKPLWMQLPEGALKAQLLAQIAELAELGSHELMQLWGLVGAPATPSAKGQGKKPDGKRGGSARATGQETGVASWQAATGVAPRRKPGSVQDRALQLLFTHSALWEGLSHAQHHLLCHLPAPYGAAFCWLEAQAHEYGPQSWAQLTARLPQAEWAGQALSIINRLPDLAGRVQALTEGAAAQTVAHAQLLEGDKQELAGIVQRLQLAQLKGQAAELAERAATDPQAFAAYKEATQAIAQLEKQRIGTTAAQR